VSVKWLLRSVKGVCLSVRHADIGSGSDVGLLHVAHAEGSLWAGVAQQARRPVFRLRAFVPFRVTRTVCRLSGARLQDALRLGVWSFIFSRGM